MSSCADFFSTFCPKAWFAFATSDCSPTEDVALRSNAAASYSARRPAHSDPRQRICRVAPSVQEPCWSSNTSPEPNFTSSMTCASPLHGGAALTAHKTSVAYDASTPVAPWHARACNAAPRPQAAQARCRRHSDTPCSTQLPSMKGFSPLGWLDSVPTIATIVGNAPLKVHR